MYVSMMVFSWCSLLWFWRDSQHIVRSVVNIDLPVTGPKFLISCARCLSRCVVIFWRETGKSLSIKASNVTRSDSIESRLAEWCSFLVRSDNSQQNKLMVLWVSSPINPRRQNDSMFSVANYKINKKMIKATVMVFSRTDYYDMKAIHDLTWPDQHLSNETIMSDNSELFSDTWVIIYYQIMRLVASICPFGCLFASLMVLSVWPMTLIFGM